MDAVGGYYPLKWTFKWDYASRVWELVREDALMSVANSFNRIFSKGEMLHDLYRSVKYQFSEFVNTYFSHHHGTDRFNSIGEERFYAKGFFFLLYTKAYAKRNLNDQDFLAVFERRDPRLRDSVPGELHRDGDVLVVKALDTRKREAHVTSCAERTYEWGTKREDYHEDAGVVLAHRNAHYGGDHFHVIPHDQKFQYVRIDVDGRSVTEMWHGVHLEFFVEVMNLFRKAGQTLAAMRNQMRDPKVRSGYMSLDVLRRGIVNPEQYAHMIPGANGTAFYMRLVKCAAAFAETGYLNPGVASIMSQFGKGISDIQMWKILSAISYLGIIGSPGTWETEDEFPYVRIGSRYSYDLLTMGINAIHDEYQKVDPEFSEMFFRKYIDGANQPSLENTMPQFVMDKPIAASSAVLPTDVERRITLVVSLARELDLHEYSQVLSSRLLDL
jgi:hypothetical protein